MIAQANPVVAVIPTYRPGEATERNIRLVAPQVSRVIVVDDGSPGADDILRRVREQGTEVVRLEANTGIAHALNVGVRAALDDPSTELVVTLDQDTRIDDGFVAAAVSKHQWHRADRRVGIVAPMIVSGQPVRTRRTSGHEAVPMEPIQSGLVISRATFEEVGLFREDFFIDCVDTEFLLRASRAGFETILCPECAITHELGEARSTLPGRPGIAVHPPFRRFYMTRNRLAVFREFGRQDRRWFRHSLVAELMGLTLTLVRGDHRRHQLRAVAFGVSAFRSSTFGPIPPDVNARLDPSRDKPDS